MERPVLYHDPTSEPSRAVHWFALEAEIELVIEYTWLTRGEHRKRQFLAINPSHQVPALKHGDFCLAEASAIMIYLAETNGMQDRWIGESAGERAKTFQFLSWHHINTRLNITLNYFLPVLLMPAYRGVSSPGAEKVKQLRETGKESLQMLEKIISSQGTFLGGNRPSMADFFVASDLFALDVDPTRHEWFSDCPAVNRWLEKLRKRDGYRSSHSQWNAIIPHVRELISNPIEGSDPGWVAEWLKNQGTFVR